jgi:uncharacterized heparinase superfamily protein
LGENEMNTRMIILASSRLSLEMVIHQVRRILRNQLTSRFPRTYRTRLVRETDRFPVLMPNKRPPDELVTFIAAFYRQDADAMADAASGSFLLMGARVDFGSVAAIDWHHRLASENDHHLWRMKLCQLEILHSLIASGTPEHVATTVALLDRVEEACGFDTAEAFTTLWSPYGASHRMLAMLSGLASGQAGALDPQVRQRVEAFIRRDGAFVRLNVEHELRNNHTERNLAALCLYGMMAETVPAALARRLDREVGALVRDTILPDGMQIERSAMYQGLTVMALRIFAAAPFLGEATRKLAADRAAAAAAAWAFMSHADGEVALFNDSWTGEIPPARSLLKAIDVPPSLSDAGYMRLAGSGCDMWMDAGAIGPSWNPGHGHADFLSMEIDVKDRRFIVDPGTSQYSTGANRMFERSAASHNGPRYKSVEPVEYFGCFKVGRMTEARPIDPAIFAKAGMAAIGGQLDTPAGRVRRVATHIAGSGLLIVDCWSGLENTGAVRLLVPATWSLDSADEQALDFSYAGDAVRLTVLAGAIASVSEGLWSQRYMVREGAYVIEIAPEPTGSVQMSAVLVATGPPPSDAAIRSAIEQCAALGEDLS